MSASEDAAALRKAMKGFGTNEDAINAIVGNRSCDQLVEIVETYSKEIERDLIKDFKDENSGDYEQLLVALCQPLASYCADVIFNAVDGMGTDENKLIEIICMRSAEELLATSEIYQTRYGKDMHVHVKSDCGGNLGDALSNLIRHAVVGEGKEAPMPPQEQLDEDVAALYAAGEDKFGTDEAKFVDILTNNNREYCYMVAEAYAQAHGTRLDKVISSEMGGHLKQCLQYRVRPAGEILAERLNDALDGINNNDRVIRLVTTNKHSYLSEANVHFLAKYGKTLPKFFHDEIGSGDYRNLLEQTTQVFGDPAEAEAREAARLAAKLADM